ncbi:DUF6382 domain-containing protein [Saccharibacillus sacchari]|uniref:DUF6382 domain-containing protein n=1 Tax=Saccharibacillus sacchari TaxID=456493 RepID=A0ACC6PIJ4_9BACL
MEEFVTDFIQSDTTYMVLKNKRKLSGDDLNRIQVKMLASSNVPHVLDLHVREVDAEAELHYNIGGKRMLSTCMKTEKITLVEYYALLLQIVTALEYGMTYMLNPNGFLLKEDYMFVEGPLSEGTVYLTYLPLNKSVELAPSRERIGGLAARWMASVDDLRGSGVQRILQMCEQSSFSLQSLKNLLIGLLAGSGKQPTGGLAAAGAAAPKPFAAMGDYRDIQHGARGSNGNGYDGSAPQGSWPQENSYGGYSAASSGGAAYGESASAFSMNNRTSMPYQQATPTKNRYAQAPAEQWRSGPMAEASTVEQEETTGRRALFGSGSRRSNKGKGQLSEKNPESGVPSEEAVEDNKNGRLVVPLICVMLLVVLWKFLYLDSPGTMNLLICVVATPILLVFAYLGWARKLKFGKRGADRMQEEEEAAALSASWQEPRGASGHRVFYGQQENESVPAVNRNAAGEWNAAGDSGNEGFQLPDFLKPSQRYGGGRSDEFHAPSSAPSAFPGTGMLVPPASQPTVMLDGGRGAGQSGSPSSSSRYRLERLENGSLPKSIVLPMGSFTIGRSEDVSQHVETAAGISRAHVELELTGAQCTIKDIGSRNGTILNDEALTPYKAYDLNEGDTFKIADISYTLRCG